MHSISEYRQYWIIIIKLAKRLDFNCAHHKKKWQLCGVTEVLTMVATMATISHYLSASNQHGVCLLFTWCSVSNTFQPPQHFTPTSIAIQNQQHQQNKQKLRISEDVVKLELLWM